jgi:uncharacterized protein (DUF58 family)
VSTKTWTKITQLSSTAGISGTLVAESIGGSGQRITAETTVLSSVRGRLSKRAQRLRFGDQGPVNIEEWAFYTTEQGVLEDDILLIDGMQYQVHARALVRGGSTVHHVETIVHRLT